MSTIETNKNSQISNQLDVSASKNPDSIANVIVKRTQEANKTYGFLEDHDPTKPVQSWYQESQDGSVFFVVFYTQSCRWARCLGCNLPSQESQYHVTFDAIMKQIDYVFDTLLVDEKKAEINKFIISNNGSVLDEGTFSTTALLYLIAKLNIHLPNLSVVAMETRPEYVDVAELEIIARSLKEGKTPTKLELAIGFESFDDTIRNKHFDKGLELKTFEQLAQRLAPYAMMLKVYFMCKPVPDMSEDDAIADVKAGIKYLDSVAKQYNITINMHLNPTYAAKGTALEKAFYEGQFQPPQLSSVAKAVLEAEGRDLSIFIGLYDEGLAVPGGSFIRPGDAELIKALEHFNKTQDYSIIKKALLLEH